MKMNVLQVVREALVAFGGWVAGGYFASKASDNPITIQTGKFVGMFAAEFVSRAADRQPVKEPNSQTALSYRTDHAERIKTNTSQSEKSLTK